MGDVINLTTKTAEERMGMSNGNIIRQNRPTKEVAADMAVAFYETCWESARDISIQDKANKDNNARLCVHTETLAMQFIKTGVAAYREKGNLMADQTADALEKLIEKRFPNGSQLQQRLI